MGTTRFPNGVTNANQNGPLSNLTQLDPTVNYAYFEDFSYFAAANWTVTAVGTTPTTALTTGNGGLLLITNTAADDDSCFLDKVGSSFLLDATKQSWFKTRFKVSDATQADVIIGLQITDTTPLSVTDGIFFQKDDGDTHIDFYCRKDATTGSTSVTDIGELANDTFIELAWYYNGSGNVYAFINGNAVANLATTGFFPDATLTVSFGIQNGEAVSKTMTVDYILAVQER